jgi:hypothetical protein
MGDKVRRPSGSESFRELGEFRTRAAFDWRAMSDHRVIEVELRELLD